MQTGSLAGGGTHHNVGLLVRACTSLWPWKERGDCWQVWNLGWLALSPAFLVMVLPLPCLTTTIFHDLQNSPFPSDRLMILVISPAMLGAICLEICVGMVKNSQDLDLSWFIVFRTSCWVRGANFASSGACLVGWLYSAMSNGTIVQKPAICTIVLDRADRFLSQVSLHLAYSPLNVEQC